jgi:hypothetical protein
VFRGSLPTKHPKTSKVALLAFFVILGHFLKSGQKGMVFL